MGILPEEGGKRRGYALRRRRGPAGAASSSIQERPCFFRTHLRDARIARGRARPLDEQSLLCSAPKSRFNAFKEKAKFSPEGRVGMIFPEFSRNSRMEQGIFCTSLDYY